ncbi:MAG: chromosome segregation protein SMC [Clostridiales bacterium]|nr:chromosome segregation protein SMC [Clostridiales bacterium]
MRLTKLHINGFKSFASKTELIFGDGITAIVGPNGSGKSNICDAVRWVLGEQSAKALRGTKMEDVIFNGTQAKKAQSFCEVTLSFDNADKTIPLDFSELAVTRRVFRSGESEYRINGAVCRMRDIQKLFADTGIGKDGYSVISQGKVDEILSGKSGDRRIALEEAAGIQRYRLSREETLRKLDATDKNMERLADILHELGERVEPLREQSEKARAYLALREELKDCEVNMYLYRSDRLREKLRTLAEAIRGIAGELAEREGVEEAQKYISLSLEGKLAALDVDLARRHADLLTELSGSEGRVGENRVLLERRGNLTERLRKLQEEEREAGTAQSESYFTENGAQAALEAQVHAARVALTETDESLEGEENALEARKQNLMDALNRAADMKSSFARHETMKTALLARREELLQTKAKAVYEQSLLQAEAEELEATRVALQAEKDAIETDLRAVQARRTQSEQNYASRVLELQKQQEQNGAATARLQTLREMAQARDGYQNSVRRLLQDAERDAALGKRLYGSVAELFRVPVEYETAIAVCLGASAQNIVTPTDADAQFCIEYLRRRDYGRVTFLPVNMLHITELRDRELLREPGVLGLASELIDCDEPIRPALRYLLGRTVLARDLNAAVALKRKSRNAFHIATLQGDFISMGGAMTGGGTEKRSAGGILSRAREISELETAVQAGIAAIQGLEAMLASRKNELMLLDVQCNALSAAFEEKNAEHTRHVEQIALFARDDAHNAERLQSAAEGLADIDAGLVQANEGLRDSQTEQTEGDERNAAARAEIVRLQKELTEKRAARERENQALIQSMVQLVTLQKETDAKIAEQMRRERDTAARKQEMQALQAQLTEIETQILAMESHIISARAHTEQTKEELAGLQLSREEMQVKLQQSRNDRDSARETERVLSEQKHKQELAAERAEMELRQLEDRIWEDYSLTYDNALPLRHEIAVQETNARITTLRAQIRELGEVNPAAMEEYRAISERYTTLSAQQTDMEQAKTDLLTVANSLTQQMESIFKEEFAKLQTAFTTVFAELFGGGHAELRLGDPNDVLGCEIVIIAQPPGKKLQLLSLLSGGERALTAIALLFAMLRVKAPAFCILDEIETSLDEANVTRFADFLRAYAGGTQFILITHRKGSMAVCDSLYGVAMQEKGVSSIVSAKFGGA